MQVGPGAVLQDTPVVSVGAEAEPRPTRPSRFVAAALGLGLILIATLAIGGGVALASHTGQDLEFGLLAAYAVVIGLIAVVPAAFNLVALRGGAVPVRPALVTVVLASGATVVSALLLLVPATSLGVVLAVEVLVFGGTVAIMAAATWVAARRAALRRAAARRAAAH